jgi:hypothetical protein
MKLLANMTTAELAAYVQSHLRSKGIETVLTGGSVVSIYSQQRYVSKDLDFVIAGYMRRHVIREAMEEIGFKQSGRHYVSSETVFVVEFPGGPLSIGQEGVSEIDSIELETGILKIISPTDCIKDRLAAYYHWGDLQCLEQATLVAEEHSIDLKEIKRWSEVEGKLDEFQKINHKLEKKYN